MELSLCLCAKASSSFGKHGMVKKKLRQRMFSTPPTSSTMHKARKHIDKGFFSAYSVMARGGMQTCCPQKLTSVDGCSIADSV